MPYCYEYPRPMVTVDAVVFVADGPVLEVLLIRRKHEPFEGHWALPGGFVEMDETLDAAVARELGEETGLSGIGLRQFHTFGDPGRDPRGRSISTAYLALANKAGLAPKAADDAAEVGWWPAMALPSMAFDHTQIVACGIAHLGFLVAHTAFAKSVLPDEFRLEDLGKLYKTVYGRSQDEESLYRTLATQGLIAPVAGPARPGNALFRFSAVDGAVFE